MRATSQNDGEPNFARPYEICNKQTTTDMPFITRKKIEALRAQNEALRKDNETVRAELKGYYDEGANADNQFFKALADRLRYNELPPFTPISRNQIKDQYETSAPVQGVVNYVAAAVGDVMPYLELTDKNDAPVENHWLLDLLRRPNDRFSLRKFGEAWAINKCLFGDAWVYAPKKVGKDKGRINEMYIIPSQCVEVQRGGVFQPLKGIKLIGDYSDNAIRTADIFSSFDYNLDPSTFFGTSKIVAAAVYLSVMERGMRREDTALNNGGVANIITPAKDTMGVMPKDADALEAKVNKGDNINKTLAMRIPIDVHQLGNAPVDLDILSTHKEAVTALCFVFKLPVDLYYGQAKYENTKEAKKTLYEQNAVPMANEFAEDLLRYTGLDAEGYSLRVNTDKIDALQDSPTDVLDNLTKMHATLNELREAYGYDRIDEAYADQPILQMGVQFGDEGVPDIDEE